MVPLKPLSDQYFVSFLSFFKLKCLILTIFSFVPEAQIRKSPYKETNKNLLINFFRENDGYLMHS